MIILTNSLAAKDDEGCLRVAGSLVKRIRKLQPDTTVVCYDRTSHLCDIHLEINKLMLSIPLIRLLWKRKEPVLYIPFPAKILSTAIRIFILSRFARWGLQTVMVMRSPMGWLPKLLIRASGTKIIAISADAYRDYRSISGDRVTYLKTGVDTARFHPGTYDEKLVLRQKYGLPADKPIVLHVGHMKENRNVGVFLGLEEMFHGLIVASTLTAGEKDTALQKQLVSKPNITVFDTFLPNIEEIYRLADVYLFPVTQIHACIDAPLSALEAAASGIPVVAAPYGELKELLRQSGFYEIHSFEPKTLNDSLRRAYRERISPREAVLEYDWNRSVGKILSNP